MASKKYTLEPGRCIMRDGKPFACIKGLQNYQPVEMDEFAHTVVDVLNNYDKMLAALKKIQDELERAGPVKVSADAFLAIIEAITEAEKDVKAQV